MNNASSITNGISYFRRSVRDLIVGILAKQDADMGKLSRDVLLRRGGNISEISGTLDTIKAAIPPSPHEVLLNFINGQVIFGKSEELYWETPAPRAIITPQTRRLPKTLQQQLRKTTLKVQTDVNFDAILQPCRREAGTWITEPIIELYRKLHEQGWVYTMGAFRDDSLVAGIWGLEVGGCLGIMSLFHTEPNSGSICFGRLIESIGNDARLTSLDCGYMNPHFERHGAVAIPRSEFSAMILSALRRKGPAGRIRGSITEESAASVISRSSEQA